MRTLLFAVVASVSLLALVGCSKTNSSGIDTAKVESVFATVNALDKAEVDKAIAAVKSGDYATAASSLNQAVANVRLTPEQKQALKDLLAQVQTKLSGTVGQAADKAKAAGEDAAKKVSEGAGKAVSDLKKAVGK